MMPTRTIRSVPVVIEASSGSFDRAHASTMEVCGSWSDNDYISCDEQEGRLRETIADAMRDAPPIQRGPLHFNGKRQRPFFSPFPHS